MEDDPNVIFSLRAITMYTQRLFAHPHNKRYHVPPPPSTMAPTSREASVATNIGDEGNEEISNNSAWDQKRLSEQLRFTFDKKPNNMREYVFGSDRNRCDIYIGESEYGTSNVHFRITYDDQGRLVLIDSSKNGTAVSYGGQARDEKRRSPRNRKEQKTCAKLNDFTWILFPGPEIRVIIGHNIAKLPDAPVVEFSVKITDPEPLSHCQRQHVLLKHAFLTETQAATPFGLNIHSNLATAEYTGSHPPAQLVTQCPIWIHLGEIGYGESGIVSRVVDVSTGVLYAAKTLLQKSLKHRKRWDREVALLRTISHDHIVKFVNHDTERDVPRLILEYMPLGNLEKQLPLERWESVTLLHQGADALDYLHSRNIAHRDLKPENILVRCREPTRFCIKIGDFGLAKETSDSGHFKSFCGTQRYLAPEIWKSVPYTVKVDIWSLGLIVFQCMHGLPEVSEARKQFHHGRWYGKIEQAIASQKPDELLDFVRSSMLTMDPDERLTASECLGKSAKFLAAIGRVDPGTPTEPMTPDSMLHAFWDIGDETNRQGADAAAETKADTTTPSSLHPVSRPREDRRDSSMTAGDMRNLPDFSTLQPLNPCLDSDEYPGTMSPIGSSSPVEEDKLKAQASRP